MAGRKKPQAQARQNNRRGRVDDFLVRGGRVRDGVQKILSSQQADKMTVEEARRLAAQIKRKGPLAIGALFDRLFDKDPLSQRLAIMLLTEIDDPFVFSKARQLLKRPNLPEKVRVALLTIEALNKSSPLSGSLPEDASELSLDALLQFTDDFWQYMEAEEISTMWLENFVGESPQERLLMLELLMKSAHARLLGVARLEIALAAPEIMRFLAEKLGDFRSSQAARLLEILLDHPDSAIRRAAACSLNRWNERNPSGASDADDAASAVHFYHAQMATDEWEGQYSLVYAVRSADGQIKFFVTLLDRWDRGIVDCWGCVRYSEQEYDKMLESMAADLADLRQRDIAKHTALTLLTKAMELNAQRKHPLPLEFCVWLHLFENEQFEPDPKVPKFGEDCDICHKPLETGPRRAPWVFGNMVVCNRCCDRTLHCPNCSEQTSLAECLLRCDPGNRHVIKCPGCSHSLEMPT